MDAVKKKKKERKRNVTHACIFGMCIKRHHGHFERGGLFNASSCSKIDVSGVKSERQMKH